MSPFHGHSAFPITPMNDKGEVDTDNLAALITRIENANVASIGLLGSTGSYVYLSRAERKRAVAAAAAAITNTPLIVGVGSLRTDEAVALAYDAAEAGADALLLAPVSYTPLTQAEAFTHFRTVAASTGLPICIYNNPGTTHFNFGLPLLAQLGELPNIQGIKMPLPSSGTIAEDLVRLREVLPADFALGYSGDWGIAETFLGGADAFYGAMGGALPQTIQTLANAAKAGDHAAVATQNAALEPLWAELKMHGGSRVAYSILRHLGLTTAQPPKPVMLAPADAEARILTALENLELT